MLGVIAAVGSSASCVEGLVVHGAYQSTLVYGDDEGCDVLVDRCNFAGLTHTSPTSGGAIYFGSESAHFVVRDSQFTECASKRFGGGVFASGPVVSVTSSCFLNCSGVKGLFLFLDAASPAMHVVDRSVCGWSSDPRNLYGAVFGFGPGGPARLKVLVGSLNVSESTVAGFGGALAMWSGHTELQMNRSVVLGCSGRSIVDVQNRPDFSVGLCMTMLVGNVASVCVVGGNVLGGWRLVGCLMLRNVGAHFHTFSSEQVFELFDCDFDEVPVGPWSGTGLRLDVVTEVTLVLPSFGCGVLAGESAEASAGGPTPMMWTIMGVLAFVAVVASAVAIFALVRGKRGRDVGLLEQPLATQ